MTAKREPKLWLVPQAQASAEQAATIRELTAALRAAHRTEIGHAWEKHTTEPTYECYTCELLSRIDAGKPSEHYEKMKRVVEAARESVDSRRSDIFFSRLRQALADLEGGA